MPELIGIIFLWIFKSSFLEKKFFGLIQLTISAGDGLVP